MDYFPNVIGQKNNKKKLTFYLDGYKHTRVSPNLLFVGMRGGGKTHLAYQYARNLNKFDGSGKKPLIPINGGVLRSSSVFFENFFLPKISNNECTVFIDECHEIDYGLVTQFLTLFDHNQDNKTQLEFPDYTVNFDFSLQTFIFATSEPHRLLKPFLSRLERIDLEDYTVEEFAQIVKQFVSCEFEPTALLKLCKCLRGDAREAAKIAKSINSFLKIKNKKFFDEKDWREFSKTLSIRPLGLNNSEIKTLEILKDNNLVSLTNLSAKLEMTRAAVQKEIELILLKHGLMKIEEKGRRITKKGLDYLASL